MKNNTKTVIGRATMVQFFDLPEHRVPAKVDTGADISSIWASDIHVVGNGDLVFMLFGPSSQYFSGQQIVVSPPNYRVTPIENSFGLREDRYVVKLRIQIEGRRFKATFTLADRSVKTYPILLGRRLLNGKFIVDVSQGKLLHGIEPSDKREIGS
jgi:hypothetical protein